MWLQAILGYFLVRSKTFPIFDALSLSKTNTDFNVCLYIFMIEVFVSVDFPFIYRPCRFPLRLYKSFSITWTIYSWVALDNNKYNNSNNSNNNNNNNNSSIS